MNELNTKPSVSLSFGVRELVEKLTQKWRTEGRGNLRVGREIEGLEGDGVAVYVCWTTQGVVLHRYVCGRFPSKNCKRVRVWVTPNGIWVVGFVSKEDALKFVEELKEMVKGEFGREFAVNYHTQCFS